MYHFNATVFLPIGEEVAKLGGGEAVHSNALLNALALASPALGRRKRFQFVCGRGAILHGHCTRMGHLLDVAQELEGT